jgi:hypothetical protein
VIFECDRQFLFVLEVIVSSSNSLCDLLGCASDMMNRR